MELGKLILKEGRVEIASSISPDQSKINTVSLVLEYIPSIASSSSSTTSSSSSSTISYNSTSTIASSITSDRKEEKVTDGVHIEREVSTSTGMDELKAILKEERRKRDELERELVKLRGDIDRVQISTPISSIPTGRKQDDHRGEIVESFAQRITSGQSAVSHLPNRDSFNPYHSQYFSCPLVHPYPSTIPQEYLSLHADMYNPNYNTMLYPEGVKYTLKYGGDHKKESIMMTERMFAYFLLGEGHHQLPGINVTLTLTEQQMIDGYQTDHPRAMSLSRAAYSTKLYASKPDISHARRYCYAGGRRVVTHDGIFGILGTFCCLMGYQLERMGSTLRVLTSNTKSQSFRYF